MSMFASSRPAVNVRILPRFPASVLSGSGVKVTRANATFTFDLDVADLADGGAPATPSNIFVPGYDAGLGANNKYRLDNIIASATGIDSRTPRGDADYSITINDRFVALTATLTAVRTWTLPAASTVPGGRSITIQDEAGGISAASHLLFAPTGADTIDGLSGYRLKAKFGGLTFRSNGTNRWSVAYTWQLAPVADTAYTAQQGDQIIAYTSLTAARIVTMPAAANYPAGQRLTVVDFSGSCSAANTISISRAGADTINGATSHVISLPFGYATLIGDGTSKWTVVDSSVGNFSSLSVAGTATFGGAVTITSNSANALAIGPNGQTNPTLRVDAAFAAATTGLYLRSLPAGSSMLIQTLSPNALESLVIDAKGTGSVVVGGNSTGGVVLASGGGTTTISGPATVNGGAMPTPGFINGLNMSATGTTSLTIGAGFAADAANNQVMTLGAFTKTTSAWAVGSAAGGLDTGAIANNTWYHVWLIKRIDTGVVDVLVSLSPSAPTMPTNYTLKRRIGSALTDGSGNWVAFNQNGDEFLWAAPISEIAAATPPDTVAHTITLAGCPTGSGIKVNALLHVEAAVNTAAAITRLRLSSLDVNDVTPAVTDSTLTFGQSANNAYSTLANIRASAGQIRYRFNGTTNVQWWLTTNGFSDTRGR